ncbi:MAG: efflux RND transporter permease subunit, partial [Dehalococcoidia bacterium]|nr:efflux RND transporter permease subunit [Dehalococcoidia bacterium]
RARSVFDVIRDLRQQAQPIMQQSRASIVFTVANPLGPTGGGSGVTIQLLGDDYATLTQLVPRVEQAIRGVRGVVDVRSTEVTGDPEIRANANRQRMADLGVSQQTIANTMRIAIAGTVVGALTPDGDLQRDITLIARPEDRAEVARLGELPIPLANGGFTRLANVTELQRATGPASINRSNRQRVLTLSANIQGRPLGEVAAEVRHVVAAVPTPPGYTITVGGGAASLDNAIQQFGGALILSVFLVYMLMVALYESFFHPLAIMFSLPVAVVGALVALWATGNTLNIFSLLGMIMLMGLVAKNGILLVDYINTVRSRGAPRLQAILEASPTRLKPIMMTSATLVFAMIPLAMKLEAGSESRAPLAVVVIGGVISSTFLTLYLVPAVYTYLDSLGAFLARLFGQTERGVLPSPTPVLVATPVESGASVAAAEPASLSSAEARPRRWFGRSRTS